jgi:hypothetical protein
MSGLVVFNQWTPVDGCSSGGDWTGEGGTCGDGGSPLLPFSEPVSVTGVNAFAPLSQTPWPNPAAPITLMVNGRGFFNTASPPDFSVSGSAITWLSSIYSVSPGDDVVAIYYYVG